MKKVWKDVEVALHFDKAKQKESYKLGMKNAHWFKVEDHVWLSSKDINLKV